MKDMNKKDEFMGLLYQSALESENEWRKDPKNDHDVKLMDDMINEMNELGYAIKYETDFYYRNITDERFLPILKKYLPQFDDQRTAAGIIGVVSKKGFKEATEFVLEMYNLSKKMEDERDRLNCASWYDHALAHMQDKSHIHDYLKLLVNEKDANNLPFTMIMLAKWHVPEAKSIFIQYLDATGELQFTAITALSYYHDPAFIVLIKPFLNSKDKNIVKCAKKAINRL